MSEDRQFVIERLQGADAVLSEMEGIGAPDEYASQVGDLGVAILVAVNMHDLETIANLCWALYRLGYKAGREAE